jgi:hypothetical protein
MLSSNLGGESLPVTSRLMPKAVWIRIGLSVSQGLDMSNSEQRLAVKSDERVVSEGSISIGCPFAMRIGVTDGLLAIAGVGTRYSGWLKLSAFFVKFPERSRWHVPVFPSWQRAGRIGFLSGTPDKTQTI